MKILIKDCLGICILEKFYKEIGVIVKFDFALIYLINREELGFIYYHQIKKKGG